LNKTDRGGTGGVALPFDPGVGPLEVSGAGVSAANGFGIGGNGGRNDSGGGHPGGGKALDIVGVGVEAAGLSAAEGLLPETAGPPATEGPPPNREAGPGLVSNGYGNNP
jgi:hypothetical protein